MINCPSLVALGSLYEPHAVALIQLMEGIRRKVKEKVESTRQIEEKRKKNVRKIMT